MRDGDRRIVRPRERERDISGGDDGSPGSNLDRLREGERVAELYEPRAAAPREAAASGIGQNPGRIQRLRPLRRPLDSISSGLFIKKSFIGV